MENKNPSYWMENYPSTCSALFEVTGYEQSVNAYSLSYIAGDYSMMSDDEVLATLINESLPK